MTPNLFIVTESLDSFFQANIDFEKSSMSYVENDLGTNSYKMNIAAPLNSISETSSTSIKDNMVTNSKKTRLILNAILLSILSVGAGWLGIVLKNITGNTNLGLLAFLVIPPLGVMISQTLDKDLRVHIGVKPKLKKNLFGYLFSLAFYPIMISLLVLVGYIGGIISVKGLLERGIDAFILATVVMFASDFLKNCLEEFTWRGFFTQRFQSLGIPDLLNHLLTGIVWIAWHIPYWLFLLDRSALAAFSTLNTTMFLLLGSLFLIANSILFGEIRLLTRSTWPVVLLHTSMNAITITLLMRGFVKVTPSAEVWMSPGGNSIFSILLITITGLVLYVVRKRRTAKSIDNGVQY